MTRFLFFIIFFIQTFLSVAQTVVPVSKEPYHRNVFENEFVRVLDVHLMPGDTTQFHKHETPSVFIVINPARTGSEVIMEETKATALASDASISFEGFYIKPRIHRVWNKDTVEFHVMDVEVLTKGYGKADAPVHDNTLKLLFDEKSARGYRLTLNAGEQFQLKRNTPLLIVSLTDASGKVSIDDQVFSKKGQFLFVPAGKNILISNSEQQTSSFVILELK